MAEKFEEIAVVVDQSSLGNGIYDLTLKTDKIAKAAKAGQFVSIYSNDKSKLLPRPISLCGINRDDDTHTVHETDGVIISVYAAKAYRTRKQLTLVV